MCRTKIRMRSTCGRSRKGFLADSLDEDMTRDWKDLDRSVGGSPTLHGGTHKGLERLELFCTKTCCATMR